MRVTERRDGTIRIEQIDWCGGQFADGHHLMLIIDPDNDYEKREIRVGDEGCLSTSHNVSPDAIRSNRPTEYSAQLFADPNGIPGNMNSNITRLHGWRGTTCDRCSEAWGWRRVESIEPRKRGEGYVVILSVDLKPDEA